MSDFNHSWLDRPYNTLTDEQLKAVADWHQGWGNKDQHRACVHMMALRTQLAAERSRADTIEIAARLMNKTAETLFADVNRMKSAIEIAILRILDGQDARDVARTVLRPALKKD